MYSFLPQKIKFLNLALDIVTPLLFVKKMIKFFILCRSKKKKKKSGHLDTIWHCYYFLYKLDINNFSKSIFYFHDVLFIWIGNRWLKWRKLTFFLNSSTFHQIFKVCVSTSLPTCCFIFTVLKSNKENAIFNTPHANRPDMHAWMQYFLYCLFTFLSLFYPTC